MFCWRTFTLICSSFWNDGKLVQMVEKCLLNIWGDQCSYLFFCNLQSKNFQNTLVYWHDINFASQHCVAVSCYLWRVYPCILTITAATASFWWLPVQASWSALVKLIPLLFLQLATQNTAKPFLQFNQYMCLLRKIKRWPTSCWSSTTPFIQ